MSHDKAGVNSSLTYYQIFFSIIPINIGTVVAKQNPGLDSSQNAAADKDLH